MKSEAVNPVLFYHPDAVEVSRSDLKGRHSAGEAFLTAFLEARIADEVIAVCGSEPHATHFRRRVARAGATRVARPIARTDVGALREQGVLNLPAPDLVKEARVRAALADPAAWAVCGVTHTICSERVLSEISDLLASAVEPWDALVCTSPAVHDAVTRILAEREDDLRTRVGATRFPRPLLPVIPLGVHAHRFAPDGEARGTWRREWGVSDDTVVLLFVGRLSVHAKASPFQLAQAAEVVARSTGKEIVVVWCGWFNDDFQRRVFLETAQEMAPAVRFVTVDGRDPKARFSIWSAADIFCSLSDNLQETFGLTIIEAMAAGLPVIASNWNGYRSTIRHGADGVLIDSLFPADPLTDVFGRYLAEVDTYDRYVGGLSQVCIVDQRHLVGWLTELVLRPDLRRRLGEAARASVVEQFDWRAVLPRYFEVWAEQRRLVLEARARAITSVQPDVGRWFASYPSARLRPTDVLVRGRHFDERSAWTSKPGVLVHAPILSTQTQYARLQQAFLEAPELEVARLLEHFPAADGPRVLRTIHWLLKVGILALAGATRSD